MKVLAVYLSLAIMLPTVLFTELFAFADEGAYTAHLLDSYRSSASLPGFAPVNERYDTDLSGIEGPTVTYGWSDAATMNNTAGYIYASLNQETVSGTEIDGIPVKFDKYVDAEGNILGSIENGKLISTADGSEEGTYSNGTLTYGGSAYAAYSNAYLVGEDDAVMFYVKMPAQAPQTEWLFQIATASMAVNTDENGNQTIYPAVAANQWLILERNVNVYFLPKGYDEWIASATVQSTVDTSKGNILFPAGFEGWVRIPASSLSDKAEKTRYGYRINIYPKQVGGDYTDGGVQYGSFMFVKEGSEAYTKAVVKEPNSTESRTADLVSARPHNAVKLLAAASFNGGIATENKTVFEDGYTYALTGTEGTLSVTSDTAAKLGTDGALLLYVKQELGEDNTLALGVNGSYGLKSGETVYTLDRGETAWTAATVTDGKLAVKSGFEGYLMVPAAALDGATDKTVSTIKFTAGKTGLSVGTAVVSGSADSTTVDIRIDGQKEYINLFRSAYYNASVIGTESEVTSTASNKNYYSVSEKTEDSSYSVGIDNGYYYEFSAGSATAGSYTENVTAEIPPFTAHLTNKFESDVRVRTGVANPSGGNYVNRWVTAAKGSTVTDYFSSDSVRIKLDGNTDCNYITSDGYFYKPNSGDNWFWAYVGFTTPMAYTSSSALVFRIQSSGSVETQGYLQLVNGVYCLQSGTVYQMLKDGTAAWTDVTVADNEYSGSGNIKLPANFSGWVKIPISAFVSSRGASLTTGELANVRYYPIYLGGKYGEVTLSHFMTVDEGGKNYTEFKSGTAVDQSMLIGDTAYTAASVPQITDPTVTSKGGAAPFKIETSTVTAPIGNTDGVKITVHSGNYPSGEWYDPAPSITDNTIRKFVGFTTGTADNAELLRVGGSTAFYVDHSDSTKAVNICVGLGTGWYTTQKDRVYYRLSENSASWQEFTAKSISGYGFLEIPADFKGWIRIPTSSIKQGNNEISAIAEDKRKQLNIYIFPDAIGGAYGSLTVGGMMFFDENDSRVFYNTGSGKKALCKGINLNVEIPTYNVTVGSFLGEPSFVTDAPKGELYSTVKLTNAATVSDGEALMLYVEQNGTTASGFRLDLGDSGMQMVSGAKYYLYDSSTQYWNTLTAADDGKMEIPAGFGGWLRIPYSSFTDADKNNASAAITFSSLNITPYSLGGAYGELKIGTFMITNNGEESLSTMRVDKAEERPITAIKAYTAGQIALDAMYPSGINARSMSVSEIEDAYLTGTVTFEVSEIGLPIVMDMTSAIEIDLSEPVSVLEKDAMLVYVSLESGLENSLLFGGAFAVKQGAAYYTLGIGNDSEWQENTVTKAGYLPLAAGFEGYVRIPVSSLEQIPESMDSFIFGFEKVGKENGLPRFGNFILTDNGEYNYTDIYLDGSTNVQSLIIPDYLEGYVLQGTVSRRDDTTRQLTTTAVGNTLTPDISEGYAFETSPTDPEAPVSLVGKAYQPRVSFDVEALYQSEMDVSGGLMFYVELPEGTSNRVFVQAQANNYARLSEGATYSILPAGDAYWTELVVNSYNELSLPEGFKGWVRLAAEDLVTAANVPLSGSLRSILLSWRHVGGEYGTPQFGTFVMLTRNTDSGKLKLSGLGQLSIYGTNTPKEYTRDDIAVWESVTAPFYGYADGDSMEISATIDKTVTAEDEEWLQLEAEREANSVYTNQVISEIPDSADDTFDILDEDGAPTGEKGGQYLSPFDARGITFSSTETVVLHGDQYPRFTFSFPVSLKDSEGIVIYVNVPDNSNQETGTSTNPLFFQLYSASKKTVTVKYRTMVATLADGTSDWKNVTVSSQLINLPSGFEGYVYIPLSALETYKNSQKINRVLNEYDEVYRAVLGFGEYGGSDENGDLLEEGKAYFGGMWLSKNGVLSHDGAYVDGSDVCRNVFTGETVDEEDVRYNPFEAPAGEGYIYDTLPETTAPEKMVMVESTTGHSASVVWDEYEGADGYRIDLYQLTAIGATGSFDQTYYTYLTSHYADTNTITINGLNTNQYYTVYIVPLKGNEGIAIYQPLSIYTETVIIGDMLASRREDVFKYAWFSYEDESPELNENTDEEQTTTTTVVTYQKKVTKRRKKSGGMELWLIIVIIVSCVVAAGGILTAVLLILRRKKRLLLAAKDSDEDEKEEEQIS